MKKNLFKLMGKNILMGSMFSIGIIITIIGVFAFESLTTTPGTAGNQSLGSQILSKLSSGGFNRTTDSLEAISDKISLIPTSVGGVSWAGYTTTLYTGALGTTKGANSKCNTDFSGSKAMTYNDFLDLGNNYPYTYNTWLIDGSYAIGLGVTSYTQVTKDGSYYLNMSAPSYIMCNGWGSNNSGFYGSLIGTNGFIGLNACNGLYKVACVYKN